MQEPRAKIVTREACDRATRRDRGRDGDGGTLPRWSSICGLPANSRRRCCCARVCAGNVAFFETALASLSGAPQHRISSLVRAGRVSGLRAAYAKAGLPPLAFDAFAAALDTWRKAAGEGGPKDKYRFTMQMVDAVIARYADITDGEMNDLTTMLRRFAADQAREAARDFAKAAVAA